MTIEKFIEIMESEFSYEKHEREIFHDLEILRRYIPTADIEVAEHDILYCCDIDELIEKGITEEDAMQLVKLNWYIEEDSLAHFV